MIIQHPIPIGKRIKSNYPACACTGKKFTELTGEIVSVEYKLSAHWYLLKNGHRVKDEWVLEVY